MTKNLPFRSSTISPGERFETFVRAVFYVGKGKRSRPYSHLYEALEYYKGDKTSKVSEGRTLGRGVTSWWGSVKSIQETTDRRAADPRSKRKRRKGPRQGGKFQTPFLERRSVFWLSFQKYNFV